MMSRSAKHINQTSDLFRFFAVIFECADNRLGPMSFHSDQIRIANDALCKFRDRGSGAITPEQFDNISLGEDLMNSVGGRTAVRVHGLCNVAEDSLLAFEESRKH